MGKILKGILGGVSGLVGPVVGAVVRGIATIRSRPKKSTKPAVESQIEQRTKFGMATKFITSLSPLINIGYQAFNKTMSSSNAAVQDLLSNAIIGIAPNYEIDYPKVTISKGKLFEARSMVLTKDGLDVILTWDPAELSGSLAEQHAKDRLFVAIFDTQLFRSVLYPGGAIRSAGKYEATVPMYYAGHPLQVWAFFRSDDNKSVSNSQYLGTTIVNNT